MVIILDSQWYLSWVLNGVKEPINGKSSGEEDAGRKNSRDKGYEVGTNLSVNTIKSMGEVRQ